jgi:hypothetical protein
MNMRNNPIRTTARAGNKGDSKCYANSRSGKQDIEIYGEILVNPGVVNIAASSGSVTLAAPRHTVTILVSAVCS